MRRLEVFWALFVASGKMFIRNRAAIFFSLFVPLLIMLIFGVLDFGKAASYQVGLVDESGTPDGATVVSAITATPGLEVTTGTAEDELAAITDGGRDLVIVIPNGFRLVLPGSDGFVPIEATVNSNTPQESQTALLIVQSAVGQVLLTASGGGSGTPLIAVTAVGGQSLAYIDFLVPGILGMTIMQLGLFSVAFGFVQLKRTGALRRLFATPTPAGYFLGAQVSSRLLLVLVQIFILLAIGIYFGLQLVGSLAEVVAVGLLGALIFLAIGFGVAGWAKNEDQAAPVANLISLPMLFLSGTFFPREAMPDFLQTVTSYLPLTYLNDALRQIINDGVSLTALGTDLIGLLVWAVISFVIAVRLFHWE
jgi:ABC-2 type transport system permease protein